MDPKIIFIISSGRSGSKSLAYTLSSLDGVDCYHLPTKIDNHNCVKYLKQISEMNSVRNELIKKSQKKKHHYIEVAQCLMHHISDVILKYPDCIIIHLVRDGRDFVRSGIGRPWYRKENTLLKRVEKISNLWVEGQTLIKEGTPQKNYGGTVRMEDLVKEGVGNFIRNNLKIEFNGNLELLDIHKTGTYEMPHWSEWDRKIRKVVVDTMGKELESYEYNWERKWKWE